MLRPEFGREAEDELGSLELVEPFGRNGEAGWPPSVGGTTPVGQAGPSCSAARRR